MAGAEMLTNGRGEYRMTPGDWEEGWGGGAELKVTQCCLKVFVLAGVFSLYLSLSLRGGSFWGVKRRLAPSHQTAESMLSH